MIRGIFTSRTTMSRNKSKEGETIEHKVERIVNNGEAINDGAPLIFTERKDGVQPAYNIRTDRFDVAIDAMDKVSASNAAKRQAKLDERKKLLEEANKKIEVGKPEPTQGTNE